MKKIIAITLVIILALAMTTTALASETSGFRLSTTPDEKFGDPNNQWGWKTGDTDFITGAMISNARSLVLTVDKAPHPGSDITLILFGDGVDWGQKAFKEADVFNEETMRIVLPLAQHDNYAKFGNEPSWAIVGFAYYGDGSGVIDDLGLKGVTLSGIPVDLFPEGAPRTGVVTFIGIAALALVASGSGAVIVARKLKNK